MKQKRRNKKKHDSRPSKPRAGSSSLPGRASFADRVSAWKLTPKQRVKFNTDDRPHDDGCHRWCGKRNADGYGVINIDGRERLVHRFVWEIAHGTPAAGLRIIHSCGHPWCVNTEHLTAGAGVRPVIAQVEARA